MRILHVTVGLSVGGAETALVALAGAQRAAGHDVAVVAVRRGGPLAQVLNNASIVAAWPGAPPQAFRALLSLPDVVHTHLFAADALGFVWARARRVAVVTTWHSVVDGYSLSTLRRRVARVLYPRFDARVAVSRAVAATFAESFGCHAVVVPNAVPAVRPDPTSIVRCREGLPHGRLVLAIGRLIASKHFDAAAAALSLLPTDVHLVVVGDGPARQDIVRAAGSSKGRIHMLGTRDDVPALLQCADAVVLPSTIEGFSMVAVEAMHAGTPIAATRAGGLADVLEGCPTPAIASMSPRAVAEAVQAALNIDNAGKFAAWAPIAAERYSPSVVADALHDVYVTARQRLKARRG